MTWNYRQGGNWKQPTIKIREDGRWITLDASNNVGDGDSPSRFYTDGPPERSGETIIYDGSNYSSMQAAYDTLSPGDTLYIDPANDPYTERLEARTDQTTIESDGALIEQPDGDEYYAVELGSGASYATDATLVGSYDRGDNQISVSDSSPFDVGDDIHITEHRRPWGEPESGGANGADTTTEYRTITAIDSENDILTVHHPLFLPYPNIESTAVGVMDWTVEDIRLTGVTLRGLADGDSRTLRISHARDAWIDNTTIEYGAKDAAIIRHSMRTRVDGITINDGGQYGLDIMHASTHTMCTNIDSQNHSRYTVRFGVGGGKSRSSSDGLVQNVSGQNLSRTVVNAHWGGFQVDYQDATAIDAKMFTLRSRHLTLNGFEKTGSKNPDIIAAQRPAHCTVKNGTIQNKPDTAKYVFRFRLRDDNDSLYGNEYFENLTFENIDIEPYGSRTKADIGHFEGDQGGDGLHFKNVTYGGEKLTESDVKSWDGWENVNITNLTVS